MNGEVFLDGQCLLTGGIYVNPGAKLEELNITENGTYYPSAGKDGFSKVVANVPQPVLNSITITENGQYTPTTGVDGYDEINVNVETTLQNKTITTNGTYTADQGYDGLGTVSVEVPEKVIRTLEDTITTNGEKHYQLPSNVDGFYPINLNVDVPANNINYTFTENGEYLPQANTDGYYKVTVDVPTPTVTLQDKTVTSNGTYTADQGYAGLGTVTVNVPGNTYLCKNLPVTAHDGTNLGAVTLPNALTIGLRYILFVYYENENAVTASGFVVDSGNSYISVNQPSGQFTITGGTTITNTRVASKGVAVSIMEIPDNLDVNPFV